MRPVVDSFWRASAYCLRPRVIALSLLPLAVMTVLALALGYFAWQPAVASVQASLGSWAIIGTVAGWLGLTGLDGMLAPLVVALVATPLVVLGALLAVATLMTPAVVSLVAQRRFPALERRRGGSFVSGALGATGLTLLALLAIIVSAPLWLVPPLILIIPPLIWGWLTFRVMSYDVLVEHASRSERETLMRAHRGHLLLMGIMCGYLSAAPSVVWASGLLFLALAPFFIALAIWIYTLVFAFSSLWFAHYLLGALQHLRQQMPPLTPPSQALLHPTSR